MKQCSSLLVDEDNGGNNQNYIFHIDKFLAYIFSTQENDHA
jgi:hypothetical protein